MIDIYYSRIACNTYVLYNEKDEGILVDPGFSRNNALIEHLKKINKNIKAILITHGHYDHIHSLQNVVELYPECKIYISADEYEFLSNSKLNLSALADVEGMTPVEYCPENVVQVNDGEIIKSCGFEIKVITTPFHTKGSVCYLVESEKALFSGDTLFYTTIGRSDLPTGSNRTIESSLKKLKCLSDDLKVYPGHGVYTNLEREKKYNTYLRNI